MLRKLRRGWNEVWRRERLDREAQAELAHHLELAAADKVRAGLDPEEARRQARLELGDPEEARERLRDGRAGVWLDSLLKDVAYALRLLRRRPAFAAACILTVALGVGASSALFAVVDAALLRPLPLPGFRSRYRWYTSLALALPVLVVYLGVTHYQLLITFFFTCRPSPPTTRWGGR